jgi:hypothetical protein
MNVVGPWFCDGCGRSNLANRYQCQQCRGINTYDLCDQCIQRSAVIHPNHSFQLVQAGYSTPMWNSTWPSYGVTMPYQWQSTVSPYLYQRQPTMRVTYEYSA